ncbi:hypothetical protein [uncultured Dysosmobacter sp.]|uniref:hypothetical protein n=1 Tax=uncultured Dysosmobacter sp. TaxID=2591384 RepID=UPI0026333AC6|nr:hypothetical protein [uncultured Dysosmobacter sp.]
MTRDDYYRILKEKHAKTDWNNLKSIKEYNRFRRMLQKLLDDGDSPQKSREQIQS